MSRHLRFSLACVLFSLLSISMAAQLPPSADAYVTMVGPSTNFGSAPILAVQEGTTMYIKFDLSALPEGVHIAKATLRLYVNNVLVPGSFDVYQVNDTWSEKALTYNNAPPWGTSATGENPINISASSLDEFIVVDITLLTKGWLNGSIPNNGVALALAGGPTATLGSFSFDSKENLLTRHQPELTIVFDGGCRSPRTELTPTPNRSTYDLCKYFQHGPTEITPACCICVFKNEHIIIDICQTATVYPQLPDQGSVEDICKAKCASLGPPKWPAGWELEAYSPFAYCK